MAISSVRELARSLGISHTTVSDALRNSPRVRKETRERVQRAAREAGYHYNPLAGALMSEMRRSGVGTFRGVLAVVDLESEAQRMEFSQRYHREIVAGCESAAETLGFKIERFVLGRDHLSVARLGGILRSRGISGLIVLPAGASPDIAELDWKHFAGLYTDYIIEHPPLDSVCSDHFRSMVLALQKLQEYGYQRPGLVLEDAHDRRLLYRWEAAFSMYQEHHDIFERISPLIVSDCTQPQFTRWFKRHEPDVVLSHRHEIMNWMEEAGAKLPETHGFCCLNVLMSPRESAGLDLQPRLIGARATEALVAQLHRNEYGVPATASTITIPAAWRDGPTIARRVRKGDRAAMTPAMAAC
ncbi:MAG: LacI family DNA-binding transcriptional regulator [Opitutales bacterium]